MTPMTSTTSDVWPGRPRRPRPQPNAAVPRYADGVTLIELLVVVAIIAIVASLTIGAVGKLRSEARRKKTLAIVSLVVDALNAYRQDWDWYPPDDNGPVLISEQNYGVKRIKQLGLGTGFHVKQLAKLGVQAVADAIREVLSDPAVRAQARRFQELIGQWQGPRIAADLIEEHHASHAQTTDLRAAA